MAPVVKKYARRSSAVTKKPESFRCHTCGDEFSSYYYMRQHEAKIHLGLDISKKKKLIPLIPKTYIDLNKFAKDGILVQRVKTAAYKTFMGKYIKEGLPYAFLYMNDQTEKPILCQVQEFCKCFMLPKKSVNLFLLIFRRTIQFGKSCYLLRFANRSKKAIVYGHQN
jgi:hypothetical protein